LIGIAIGGSSFVPFFKFIELFTHINKPSSMPPQDPHNQKSSKVLTLKKHIKNSPPTSATKTAIQQATHALMKVY
jgi:hypothetical protein